jgi:hypothetical protein
MSKKDLEGKVAKELVVIEPDLKNISRYAPLQVVGGVRLQVVVDYNPPEVRRARSVSLRAVNSWARARGYFTPNGYVKSPFA